MESVTQDVTTHKHGHLSYSALLSGASSEIMVGLSSGFSSAMREEAVSARTLSSKSVGIRGPA